MHDHKPTYTLQSKQKQNSDWERREYAFLKARFTAHEMLVRLHTCQLWKKKIMENLLTTFSGSV